MILLSLLFLVFAYISYRKPAVGLGLILGLTPSYLWRFNISSIPTTFLELLIVVFLLAMVLKLRTSNFYKIKNLGRINLAIGLFALAAIVSTIISPEPVKALGQLKAFIIEPILLFYASIIFVKKQDLNLILKIIFSAASLISLFALLQYFTHFQLPLQFWGNGEEPKRITSFFEYPNALALYLAPLIGFFVTLRLRGYLLLNKFLFSVGLGLMLVALILTFSRGAWLALIVGILLPVLLSQNWKRNLSIAATVVIALLLIPSVQQRLTLQDPSSVAHTDLMAAATDKISENPIFGNGLYGFRTTLLEQNFPGEVLNYPHNIVLNFWLELGLLGLLAFIWVLYLCFKQYKKRPTVIALAAAVYLLVMLVHGLVDVPYFKNDLSVMFWFMISLFYQADN